MGLPIFAIVSLVALVSVTAAANAPNIVFILTDDQDVVLGSMTPMERTKRLLAEQGVTFNNAFVTTPICCPSRSTILTGQYLHNHGAINNFVSDGCNGVQWREEKEPNSYGAAVHDRAGYTTFYAGKYLNEYGYDYAGGTEYVPPGWDWWIGLVGNSVYYNYTLSVNGTRVEKGAKAEDYLTYVVKDYALQFLSQPHITEGNSFLMAINPPSAHDPYTPAPRHIGQFSDVKAPRTAHFNQPSNNTKHWITRLPPAILPQETIDVIDAAYRNRWETLLAVDELVDEVVTQLDRLGILNNTYVIFMSDHGFHFGQYGLTLDKRFPYEMDIRVPLVMRGPGVPRNKTVRAPVLSTDIYPTILDMAGIKPTVLVDGESFLSKVGESPEDEYTRGFLLEYHGEYNGTSKDCWSPLDPDLAWCYADMSCKCYDMRNNTYSCIRQFSTDNFNDLFCVFDDDEHFVEMYNINNDPLEVTNLALDSKFKPHLPYDEALHCIENNKALGKPIESCLNFNVLSE